MASISDLSRKGNDDEVGVFISQNFCSMAHKTYRFEDLAEFIVKGDQLVFSDLDNDSEEESEDFGQLKYEDEFVLLVIKDRTLPAHSYILLRLTSMPLAGIEARLRAETAV